MLRAFEHHPEYAIAGTFKNGEQLIRGVKIHRPDVVMTDISMPVLSGIDAIAKIRQEYPELFCIVLTNFDSHHLILSALEAGAFSYVNKAMSKEEIFATIASSLNEIPYYCKSTSQRVLRLIENSEFGKPKKRTEWFNETKTNCRR